MKRNRTIKAIAIGLLAISTASYAQQNNQALLDVYLLEIEKLISANELEAAKDKLAEATAANLRDESLEIIYSQLRLLESMNDPNQQIPQQTPQQNVQPQSVAITEESVIENTVIFSQTAAISSELTDQDQLAALDLLDSLRIAMENGELEQVRRFSEATPETASLLDAVFQNYAAIKVEVSTPEPDNETKSFLATLEFKELTTKDGSTAFPAQAWKTHRLRIIKSEGAWQKVLW